MTEPVPAWAAPKPPPGTEIRLIPKRELLHRIPYCYSSIWRYMKDGKFPQPVQLGEHRIAWESWRIDLWIDERIKAGPVHRRNNF